MKYSGEDYREDPFLLYLFHLVGMVNDFIRLSPSQLTARKLRRLIAIKTKLLMLADGMENQAYYTPLNERQAKTLRRQYQKMQAIFYPLKYKLETIEKRKLALDNKIAAAVEAGFSKGDVSIKTVQKLTAKAEQLQAKKQEAKQALQAYHKSQRIIDFKSIISARMTIIELLMSEHSFISHCTNKKIIQPLLAILLANRKKIMRDLNLTEEKFQRLLNAFKNYSDLKNLLELSTNEMRRIANSPFIALPLIQEKLFSKPFTSQLALLSEMVSNIDKVSIVLNYLISRFEKDRKNSNLVKVLEKFIDIHIKPSQQIAQNKLKLKEIHEGFEALSAIYERVYITQKQDRSEKNTGGYAFNGLLDRVSSTLTLVTSSNDETNKQVGSNEDFGRRLSLSLIALNNMLQEPGGVTSGILSARIRAYMRFIEKTSAAIDTAIVNIEKEIAAVAARSEEKNKSLLRSDQRILRSKLFRTHRIDERRQLLATNTEDLLTALQNPTKRNVAAIRKTIHRRTNVSSARNTNKLGKTAGGFLITLSTSIMITSLILAPLSLGASLVIGTLGVFGISSMLGFSLKSKLEKRKHKSKLHDKSMKVLSGITYQRKKIKLMTKNNDITDEDNNTKVITPKKRISFQEEHANRLSVMATRLSSTALVNRKSTVVAPITISTESLAASSSTTAAVAVDNSREKSANDDLPSARTARNNNFLLLVSDDEDDSIDDSVDDINTNALAYAGMFANSKIEHDNNGGIIASPVSTPVLTPVSTPVLTRQAVTISG